MPDVHAKTEVLPVAMGGFAQGQAPAMPLSPQIEASAPADSGPPPGTEHFTSPMVGTFYRAPSPESEPFVQSGDKVGPETTLCIIEAMKVMNEIKAERNAEIIEVLVENGAPIEFGQPLFLIKPL
jgi:acetyl-CoA carboxylase biotin carboxyl carrier protein